MKFIDQFLNSITMYKLVLYGLRVLFGICLIFSLLGILAYNPLQLMLSISILVVTCMGSNFLFSRLLKAPTNVESANITALILFFIFVPLANINDGLTLVVAGVLAMGSKYVLAYQKKHLFNPAAIAAVILGLMGNGNAYWWVGSDFLLPFVLVLAFLIVRKIRRFSLVLAFFASSLLTISFVALMINNIPILGMLKEVFLSWPIVFFAGVMLTEPLTTPPTKKLQVLYGLIVGVLFGSQFQVGPLFSTPELALVLGNLFTFFVSPKQLLLLRLKTKQLLADGMYEFVFTSPQKFIFKPGQYLEWTLPHKKPDSRGNRRYFTIASSPSESEVKLGVRIPSDKKSSFKKALEQMEVGQLLSATHLAGDFTLPVDTNEKLLFVAGGIGITPFRSMIQYLLDTNTKRDIVLIYTIPTPLEISYKDVFAEAEKKLGIKTIYVITREENVPKDWSGLSGRITKPMLINAVPDFTSRLAYLSGPNAMVDAYKTLLTFSGVQRTHIKTDYFPGF